MKLCQSAEAREHYRPLTHLVSGRDVPEFAVLVRWTIQQGCAEPANKVFGLLSTALPRFSD